MAFWEALLNEALPGYSSLSKQEDAADVLRRLQSGELDQNSALMKMAEIYPEQIGVELLNNKIQQSALERVPEILGQGQIQDNLGATPWGQTNQVQSAEIGQPAPQPIQTTQQPVQQPSPQNSALIKYISLMKAGIPASQAANLVKMSEGREESTGGVMGELVDRLRKENPNMSFRDALYAIQTGMRQGTQLDESGNIVPISGSISAAQQAAYSREAGKQKAQVETAGAKAMAEQTPKIEEAKPALKAFMDSADSIDKGLDKLNEYKAIPSTNRSSISNIASYVANTGAGDIVGQAFGTKAQEESDKIENKIPIMKQQIMGVTGMSAKQMDSNVEMQNFMRTFGDKTSSYEARKDAINNLKKFATTYAEAKFGKGKTAESTKTININDINETARKSGRTASEIIEAAKKKGFVIQ